MKAKLKNITLMLGLMALLVNPAAAQTTSYDLVGDRALPDHPLVLAAGASSLVVTDNRNPAPERNPQSPGPELMVTEPLFDFDRVLEGEEVVHDFLVENHGAGPLSIHQIRTG